MHEQFLNTFWKYNNHVQEVPERYVSTSIRIQHTEHVFYEVRVRFYCKSLSKFFLLEEKKTPQQT